MSSFHIVTQINIILKTKPTTIYKPIFYAGATQLFLMSWRHREKQDMFQVPMYRDRNTRNIWRHRARPFFVETIWIDIIKVISRQDSFPSIIGRIKYFKKSSKILRLPHVIKIDDIYLSTKQIFYGSQASGPEYSVSISQLKIATLDL